MDVANQKQSETTSIHRAIGFRIIIIIFVLNISISFTIFHGKFILEVMDIVERNLAEGILKEIYFYIEFRYMCRLIMII